MPAPCWSPIGSKSCDSSSAPPLLVVLAHSWEGVERSTDLPACLSAIEAIRAKGGYRSVIWLRHWMDPEWPGLPPRLDRGLQRPSLQPLVPGFPCAP